MIINSTYLETLSQGEALDILELEDEKYTYTLSTIIVLGGATDKSVLTINGVSNLTFPGGFVYNHSYIKSVSVDTSESGVLVIGKKTKKSIF
jgi:hypothetical protein